MEESCQNKFNWRVLGHKNAINFLQQSILNNNINHAYLFFGISGVGKSTVAKNFIKSILCENLHQQGLKAPCDKCQCCQWLDSSIHPDVFQVDLERDEKTNKLNKNINLEQIRGLQVKLNHSTFLNSYKIALIYNTDSLSEEAFNALLKTLEEPTKKTILILLSNNIDSIPLTIISRCQLIKFLPVPSQKIFKYLISQEVDKKVAEELTALSGGCPGMAINFLRNNDLFLDYKKEAEEFINLIYKRTDERLESISYLLTQTADFIDNINKVIGVLNIWQSLSRDLLLIFNSSENLVRNIFVKNKLSLLSDRYSENQVKEIIKKIDLTINYLKNNVNPKLSLENLVINI